MSAIEDRLHFMGNNLLADIQTFIRETGMGPSYFGKASCGNSELVERLENGGTVTLTTADKVRAFIRERSPERVIQ